MILIEIGLTVAAWKRGWRWRALAPFVLALSGALIDGLLLGIAGSDLEAVRHFFLLLDAACILGLVAMVVTGFQPKRRAFDHMESLPVCSSDTLD